MSNNKVWSAATAQSAYMRFQSCKTIAECKRLKAKFYRDGRRFDTVEIHYHRAIQRILLGEVISECPVNLYKNASPEQLAVISTKAIDAEMFSHQ